MYKLWLTVLFMTITLHAWAQETTRPDESPKEAAAAILQLIQDKNYTDLIKSRYTEWYKAESEGDQQKAIEKLSAGFEKNRDMMIKLYEELSKAEFELGKNDHPQQSETGEIATATVTIGDKQVPFRLYKMKSGKWGFHL